MASETKYKLHIYPEVDKIFTKLAHKDKKLLREIHNKINAICQNPNKRYKFLKGPLSGLNRVHVKKHYVLIFHVDHNAQTVNIVQFAHHDHAYR